MEIEHELQLMEEEEEEEEEIEDESLYRDKSDEIDEEIEYEVEEESLNICSNCNKDLTQEIRNNDSLKRFYLEYEENGVRMSNNVSIILALNEILRWRAFGILFQTQNGETIGYDENDTKICKTCSFTIAKLYAGIKAFETLCKKDSKVYEVINTVFETFMDLTAGLNNDLSSSELEEHQQVKKTVTRFIPYKFESKEEDEEEVEEGHFGINEILVEPFSPLINNSSKDEEEENKNNQDVLPPAVENLKNIKETKRCDALLCSECGASFNKNANLRRHMLLSHGFGDKAKEFKCDSCDKSFHFQYMLKNHKRVHTDLRLYHCQICFMSFKGSDGLFHHTRDVHRSSEDMPKCNICSKVFKQERSLNEHIQSIHQIGKKKIVPCPKCGARFCRKRSMLAHLRKEKCNRAHGRPRKNPPPLPTKESSKISSRNLILSDGGYKCPNVGCEKYFSRKSSLLSHLKNFCIVKTEVEESDDDEETEDSNIKLKTPIIEKTNEIGDISLKRGRGRPKKCVQSLEINNS